MTSARRWVVDGTTTVYDGVASRSMINRVLARRNSPRVLVIANRSVVRAGLVDELTSSWEVAPVARFTSMRANAPASDVEAASNLGADARANTVVAIGGSSVTDAAKIVRIRLLGDSMDAAAIPLLLVPTTLSSGELTPAAGMTGAVAGEKSYVIDARMAPTAVVLDPELTVATPATLWLSSGIKALDHACEALWALDPHPYSDTLAAEAIRRLRRSLPRCATDGSDLAARHDAQLGGWFSMSGMTRHGPGPSHLLGHQLAARWGIGHGQTSCITLPRVLELVAHEGRPGVDAVVDALGALDVKDAVQHLERFIATLGLATRLRDVGAIESEIDAVADAAWRHGVAVGYRPDRGAEQFADVLRSCW
jgi:maleylacetate reductase